MRAKNCSTREVVWALRESMVWASRLARLRRVYTGPAFRTAQPLETRMAGCGALMRRRSTQARIGVDVVARLAPRADERRQTAELTAPVDSIRVGSTVQSTGGAAAVRLRRVMTLR